MDRYRIDSQKLIYHIPRVSDWLEGKTVYPIYMEISPAGACNHRCTYCGLDFMEYQPKYLDTELLKKRLTELGRLGLKSIMYAGEGEPFLHKDIAEIIRHTKDSDIDAAVTTNGVLFTKKIADDTLKYMKWIKIGLDGATRKTHAKIHRCDPSDFDKIVGNISYAVELKKKKRYECTIGMQFLLLPENSSETPGVAKMARDLGVNYLVIKPYSQHIQSKTKKYSTIKYGDYEHLKEKLAKFETAGFNIIFRLHTMKKWDEKTRGYKRCLALPFWSYIDSGGNVWGCSVYLGDKRFFYGNIYEKSFKEIWEGKRRSELLKWVRESFDISGCRVNCRMDEINRYLWELNNLPEHVNFI